MEYQSTTTIQSERYPGVSFRLFRMSIGRRMELTKRIRELAGRTEYLAAGTDAREKIEANLLAAEIEKTYLNWGLQSIAGLSIDGEPATPESLAAAGPEDLCAEAIAAIKRECGLTEQERKN
jgi:hypothetical protein